jgi:hypothetical protein
VNNTPKSIIRPPAIRITFPMASTLPQRISPAPRTASSLFFLGGAAPLRLLRSTGRFGPGPGGGGCLRLEVKGANVVVVDGGLFLKDESVVQRGGDGDVSTTSRSPAASSPTTATLVGGPDAVFAVAGIGRDLTLRYVTEGYEAPHNLLVVVRSTMFIGRHLSSSVVT